MVPTKIVLKQEEVQVKFDPTVCALRHQALETTQKAVADELKILNSTVSLIHNKLFVDNGAPSLQTKVNNHHQIIRALVFVVGALITGFIGFLFK